MLYPSMKVPNSGYYRTVGRSVGQSVGWCVLRWQTRCCIGINTIAVRPVLYFDDKRAVR